MIVNSTNWILIRIYVQNLQSEGFAMSRDGSFPESFFLGPTIIISFINNIIHKSKGFKLDLNILSYHFHQTSLAKFII